CPCAAENECRAAAGVEEGGPHQARSAREGTQEGRPAGRAQAVPVLEAVTRGPRPPRRGCSRVFWFFRRRSRNAGGVFVFRGGAAPRRDELRGVLGRGRWRVNLASSRLARTQCGNIRFS